MANNSEDYDTLADENTSMNPVKEEKCGKRSKIFEYCSEPKRQDKNCIWFCRRRGRGSIAWAVTIEDIENSSNAFRLRNFNKWWRRFAFYNFIGVKHVEVCKHRNCRIPTHSTDLITQLDRSDS